MCLVILWFFLFFFFFKQKTAYEMRISDWSSDVCSSDLSEIGQGGFRQDGERKLDRRLHHDDGKDVGQYMLDGNADHALAGAACRQDEEIGRASCRERVCQYV